jgi:hypothetical protein
MVRGLDGIEKLILAIDPATHRERAFQCVGYMNTGGFTPKVGPQSLVEVYRAVNAAGEDKVHTIEALYNASEAQRYEPKMFVRATAFPKPTYGGLRG